jgi:hypothetical protein
MVLKPLTLAVTTPATPPRCSLSPYKRGTSTPGPHHPFFPSLPSSLAPSFTLAPSSSHRRSSSLSFRRSCSGEHPSDTASSSLSSSTAAGKRCRALLSASPRSTVDPSCAAQSKRHGPDSLDFPLENKSEKFIIPYHFAYRPPKLLVNFAVVPMHLEILPQDPQFLKNIYD